MNDCAHCLIEVTHKTIVYIAWLKSHTKRLCTLMDWSHTQNDCVHCLIEVTHKTIVYIAWSKSHTKRLCTLPDWSHTQNECLLLCKDEGYCDSVHHCSKRTQRAITDKWGTGRICSTKMSPSCTVSTTCEVVTWRSHIGCMLIVSVSLNRIFFLYLFTHVFT